MASVHGGSSPNPFDRLLGLRITEVGHDRVLAELAVQDVHKQAHGIVHGGVYCTIIEAVASIGANVRAGQEHVAVGTSNKTTFLHAVRTGTLTATATVLFDEGPWQTWDVKVLDERSRLVADGLVSLFRLNSVPGAPDSPESTPASSG